MAVPLLAERHYIIPHHREINFALASQFSELTARLPLSQPALADLLSTAASSCSAPVRLARCRCAPRPPTIRRPGGGELQGSRPLQSPTPQGLLLGTCKEHELGWR